MSAPQNTNANVVLSANVGPYQQGMSQANDSTNQLLNTLAKLNQATDNLFKSAGRKLELFGAGSMAGITGAVASLSQLDAQLSRVRANAALTGTNIPKIASGLRELSATTGTSQRDLAQLATTIQTMGVRGASDVLKLTNTFNQLGQAVGESATGLAQDLVQLTRSMGQNLDPNQMRRYASAVNEVTQQLGVSATGVTNFAQAIQPMGKLLGISETQLIGISGAFNKAGADGVAAGNAFATIATLISNDVRTGNPQLKQFADILGVTTGQFKSMVGSNPAKVLSDLFASLNQRGPQSIQILQSLGLDGARTLQAIQRVAQGGGLQEGLTAAQRGAADPSRLSRSYHAATDDLQHNLATMGQSLRELATGPFVVLERALNRIVASFNDLLKVVIQVANLPGIHQMIEAFGTLASVSAPLLAMGGVLLTLIPLLAKLGFLWSTVFSKTGVSAVTGVTDALKGTTRTLAGAGLIQRGVYGAGQRVGAGLWAIGVGPGNEEEARGPGLVERAAARGVQGATYAMQGLYLRPIQNLSAGLRAGAWGGLGGVTRQAYQRPSMFGSPEQWEQSRAKFMTSLQNLPLIGGIFGGRGGGGKTTDVAKSADEVTKANNAASKSTAQMAQDLKKVTAEALAMGTATAAAGATTAKSSATRTAADTAEAKAAGQTAAQAERAALSLGQVAAMGARAAGSMALSAGGAVIGAAGVGARVAGTGLLAAGRGLMGALGGPWGLGLTAASIGLPLFANWLSSRGGGRMSEQQLEQSSGSFIANLNSFSSATGGATTSLADLTKAASGAAGAIGGAGGAGAPGAFSPEEYAKATDRAFKASGYGPGTGGQQAAQLIQSTIGQITKPGGGPLSADQQRQFRMNLEHLFPLKQAQDIYNKWSVATNNFTTASKDLKLTTDTYATLGQQYAQAAISAPGGGAAQRAASTLFQPLGLLAQQQYNAPADQRQGLTGQLQGMLAGILRTGVPQMPTEQLQAIASAQGITFDQAKSQYSYLQKDFYKQLAKSLGFSDKVGDVTSMSDFVKNAFGENATSAARLFPQGQGFNWNDPNAITRWAQGQVGAGGGAGGIGVMGMPFFAQGLNTLNLRQGTGVAGSVLATLGGSQNPQVQAQAIYGTATALTASGRTAAQAAGDLSNWAANADQSTDAAKNFTSAVEDLTNQMLDLQQSTMSLPQQMGNIASRLQALNPNDPNFQKQFGALQQQGLSVQQQGVQQAQQYLLAQDQLQIQLRQGREDYNRQVQRSTDAFNRQETRSQQDYNKQTARSEEDFHIQMQRANQDYQIQVRQSTQDFNKQMFRAEQDFNIQMLQAQQDYQTQRSRAQREFVHQEQLYVIQVAQSLDPWSQVQAQSVADAQQVLANVGQQNQMYKQAGQQLDTLRKMGLSQNVIDVLGLSDPKNMQQLNRFFTDVAANPQLIQSFNKSIKGRLDWTQGLATDKSSTQWREMERQFQIASQDAAADFARSSQRAHEAFARQQERSQADFQTMLDRNAEAFARQTSRSEADFEKMLARNASDFATMTARSEQDFSIQMTQMTQDYNTSVKRSLDAINHFATDAYGAASTILQKAYDKSSGDMKKYFKGIIDGINTVATATQKAAAGLPGAPPTYGGEHSGPGGPGTGGNPANASGWTPSQNQAWAKSFMLQKYGWGAAEFNALYKLWNIESGWRQSAYNSNGGATGIPQALPGNKMASFGADWRTNPITQMKWGLDYIAGRYGDPIAAYNFEISHTPYWYQRGALFNKQKIIGVGEGGPEVVFPLNERGAEFLLSIMNRMNKDAWQARMGNRYSSPVTVTTVHNQVDHSTKFTGEITVQAQDPNQMAVALENRKRLAALTAPDLVSVSVS